MSIVLVKKPKVGRDSDSLKKRMKLSTYIMKEKNLITALLKTSGKFFLTIKFLTIKNRMESASPIAAALNNII